MYFTQRKMIGLIKGKCKRAGDTHELIKGRGKEASKLFRFNACVLIL